MSKNATYPSNLNKAQLIKGFLNHQEGLALYEIAKTVSHLGPLLEVGSYCGKSTAYLGQAAQYTDNVVFAIDHHRGSEEHQLGQEYHDKDLYDPVAERINSFTLFEKNINDLKLNDTVIPIVAPSQLVAKFWKTPLGMVFIDGSHSEESAQADFENWAHQILPGGVLAIHDVFDDPEKGGQAPFNIWKKAFSSGLYLDMKQVKTLRFLQKKLPFGE